MKLLKLLKYLPRIIFKKGMPISLIYFVTSKCNAKCKHCFYWRELNAIKDELSLENIENIAKSTKNIMTLSLTGGEPFLRGDLEEIAYIFSRFTDVVNIQIPTNGIMMDSIISTTKNMLRKVRKDIRITVGVSLDDLSDKHEDLRQVKGCFQKAVETLRQLKYLENEYKNFKTGSLITISNFNQEDINNLIDYLDKELNIKEIGVNIIRSDVMDNSLKCINIKYYDEVMLRLRGDHLHNLRLTGNVSWIEKILSSRQYYGSKIISEVYSQNKYITPCYAGNLLAILRENGDVYPCEMLNERMGNLKEYEYDFKKLWFSNKAKMVRKRIKDSRCFCTYECAMTLNTLFNFKHLFYILLNSIISNNKVFDHK